MKKFLITFFAIITMFTIGFLVSCNNNDNSISISSENINYGIQYEVYILAINSGYSGTYDDWLNSISGNNDKSVDLRLKNGYIEWKYIYESDDSWIKLFNVNDFSVTDDPNYRSAYDIYVQYHPEYINSEKQWIVDLISGSLYRNDLSPTGELVYAINTDNKSYYLVSYKGYDRAIAIPERYNGYSVTGIGPYAFAENNIIEQVFIPNTVVSIDEAAFKNCIKLNRVDLSFGLKSIGDYAFYNCKYLTNLNIPNSVTSIGYRACAYCISLTNIIIPESVINLGDGVFSNCYDLFEVTVNSNIAGNYTFEHCTKLKVVELSIGLITIGNSTFFNCNNLEVLVIPESVTSLGYGVFSLCNNLTSLIIPNSVVSVGKNILYECIDVIIYSESVSKPIGWDPIWNNSNRPVYWYGQWNYDINGNPVPVT